MFTIHVKTFHSLSPRFQLFDFTSEFQTENLYPDLKGKCAFKNIHLVKEIYREVKDIFRGNVLKSKTLILRFGLTEADP